jgi:predicted DNA-binding protein YlxM (UPF0122 family)
MDEQFVEMTLLYDFYGGMLTPRQQEIMDLYYMKDYSLGEIGELLSTSRQAVYDNLKRAKKQLGEMEERLGLVQRFKKDLEDRDEALESLDSVIEVLETEQSKDWMVQILKRIREFVRRATGG